VSSSVSSPSNRSFTLAMISVRSVFSVSCTLPARSQ
jgi:hypothetical protein